MRGKKEESEMKQQTEAAVKGYYKLVAQRIHNAMRRKDISQSLLLKKCAENGYVISQSTLSKILQGTTAISLINAVQICRVLKEDIADMLSVDERDVIREGSGSMELDSPSQLIYRGDHPVFRAYLGKYHCYFFSTISNEDKIIHGILELKATESGSRCIATMILETGKKDEDGEPIQKSYEGDLVISTAMNAAYCTLVSKKIGEICYFIFRYSQINYEKLICRLAIAITVSAGDNRLPTAHRMLISKKELGNILDDYLSGQLHLNGSDILLEPENVKLMREDPNMPQWFKDNFDKFISETALQYYRAQELIVRASHAPKEDKNAFICLLRKYSSAPKYTKIGIKADEFVYELLKNYGVEKEDMFSSSDVLESAGS